MTRYEAIENALLDVLQIATADGYGITTDAPRIDRARAALALPEDSKTVNAELYGLAIAMADYCARTDIEFASTKEFAEFIGLPGIELDKIMEAMQNANHYLSLREASGEPMPYKVVREGDKVRFE